MAWLRRSRAGRIWRGLQRRGGESFGLGNVERNVEVVPGGFGVREMDRPADVGIVRRHLGDDLAVPVEAVEAEARRLRLDPPRGVLEPTGRHGVRSGRLRSEEPLVRAIADPGDANGGVDDDPFDLAAIALLRRRQRAIPGEARGERRAAEAESAVGQQLTAIHWRFAPFQSATTWSTHLTLSTLTMKRLSLASLGLRASRVPISAPPRPPRSLAVF